MRRLLGGLVVLIIYQMRSMMIKGRDHKVLTISKLQDMGRNHQLVCLIL